MKEQLSPTHLHQAGVVGSRDAHPCSSTQTPEGVHLKAVPILSRLRLHELLHHLDPEMAKPHRCETEQSGEITWF